MERMNVRRNLSAIFVCLMLAACSGSDELAPDGQITVVGPEIRTSIQTNDLTNPDAYFERMTTILSEAPPSDYRDLEKIDNRISFLKNKLGPLLNGYFLIPIGCSDEKDMPYLKAEKNTKTIRINLARIDEKIQTDFQDMVDKISNLERKQFERFRSAIRGWDSPVSEFMVLNRLEIRLLSDAGANASIIDFGNDHAVFVSNNPIGYVDTEIRLAVSESDLVIAQAGLSALRGRFEEIDPKFRPFDKISRLLQGGASGVGPKGWTENVPYSDDRPVCLIGHFEYLDPVPGGLYAYFSHPKGASFSTSLKAWYLVEKETLNIVHAQGIAKE